MVSADNIAIPTSGRDRRRRSRAAATPSAANEYSSITSSDPASQTIAPFAHTTTPSWSYPTIFLTARGVLAVAMTTGTLRRRADAKTETVSGDSAPSERRAVAPVFPSEAGPWVLTSYDACALAFRSPAFGQGESAELVRQDPRFEWSTVLQSLGQMMVFMDPPDHTRLRRIVSRVFSPRVIEQLR